MGKVSIVKINGSIRESLIACLDNIGGLLCYVKPGDKVLLKPNINGTEAVTDTRIVEALILLLRECGVGQIAVAESTFGSARMTDHCFSATGYSDLAIRQQVPLINLNRSRKVTIRVPDPFLLKEIGIAEEAYASDLVINIPVMKVHYATAVTLSLKNMKGLLVGDDKRRFHEIGLDKAIVDLNNACKPTLNIVDCINCMERMGPRGGDVVKMNLLIAGYDRGEVDCIGSRIMGFSPDEVKHLRYYIHRNQIDARSIETTGERVDEVRRPFSKARVDGVIPECFNLYNENACSSCMNAFLLSCEFLKQECSIAFDIFMGEKAAQKYESDNLKIAFGSCAVKRRFNYDEVVRGCPPYPFELRNLIERRFI